MFVNRGVWAQRSHANLTGCRARCLKTNMAEVYVGKRDPTILFPTFNPSSGELPYHNRKLASKKGVWNLPNAKRQNKTKKLPHLGSKLAALQGDKPQRTKRQLWGSATPPVSQRRRGPAAPRHVWKEPVCQVGGLMGLHLAPVASVAPHACKSPSPRTLQTAEVNAGRGKVTHRRIRAAVCGHLWGDGAFPNYGQTTRNTRQLATQRIPFTKFPLSLWWSTEFVQDKLGLHDFRLSLTTPWRKTIFHLRNLDFFNQINLPINDHLEVTYFSNYKLQGSI